MPRIVDSNESEGRIARSFPAYLVASDLSCSVLRIDVIPSLPLFNHLKPKLPYPALSAMRGAHRVVVTTEHHNLQIRLGQEFFVQNLHVVHLIVEVVRNRIRALGPGDGRICVKSDLHFFLIQVPGHVVCNAGVVAKGLVLHARRQRCDFRVLLLLGCWRLTHIILQRLNCGGLVETRGCGLLRFSIFREARVQLGVGILDELLCLCTEA
mmetsp:Transcript_3714/g.4280  ORF Transcript_3714/g.4280 Transcript_3714/m.4280 type:complete len:210 (-) Transcript_3714:390-1019(-)